MFFFKNGRGYIEIKGKYYAFDQFQLYKGLVMRRCDYNNIKAKEITSLEYEDISQGMKKDKVGITVLGTGAIISIGGYSRLLVHSTSGQERLYSVYANLLLVLIVLVAIALILRVCIPTRIKRTDTILDFKIKALRDYDKINNRKGIVLVVLCLLISVIAIVAKTIIVTKMVGLGLMIILIYYGYYPKNSKVKEEICEVKVTRSEML